MSSQDEIVRAAHAELARLVLADRPVRVTLTRFSELAQTVIPGAGEVSVTLLSAGGRAGTVALSSGNRAALLDQAQYRAGHGPSLDAAAGSQMISVADTANESRYPDFARRARRAGVPQTLAVGLPRLHETGGSINLYGHGRPFDRCARDLATEFASYAALALVNAALYAGVPGEIDRAHAAMVDRATIEQAKGMVMARRGCTGEEASHLLNDLSARTGRTLADVAHDLVFTRRSTSPIPGGR